MQIGLKPGINMREIMKSYPLKARIRRCDC